MIIDVEMGNSDKLIYLISDILTNSDTVKCPVTYNIVDKNNEEWNGPKDIRINSKDISIVPFEERAIQEGIYYTPNIEYMVFDIAVIKDGKQTFIDYNNLIEYVKRIIKITAFMVIPVIVYT